jgi:hypothetical protein
MILREQIAKYLSDECKSYDSWSDITDLEDADAILKIVRDSQKQRLREDWEQSLIDLMELRMWAHRRGEAILDLEKLGEKQNQLLDAIEAMKIGEVKK